MYSKVASIGTKQKIFINESLTKNNKQIFHSARLFKKDNHWKYCWTKNGVTYLKWDDSNRPSQIKSESDLEALKPNDP